MNFQRSINFNLCLGYALWFTNLGFSGSKHQETCFEQKRFFFCVFRYFWPKIFLKKSNFFPESKFLMLLVQTTNIKIKMYQLNNGSFVSIRITILMVEYKQKKSNYIKYMKFSNLERHIFQKSKKNWYLVECFPIYLPCFSI